MRVEETWNKHKIANAIFPFYKSKKLCEKGIHNYRIERNIVKVGFREIKNGIFQLEMEDSEDTLKCFCCGKEEVLEE